MMGWSAIVLSFAAKQYELHGTISPAMWATLTLQLTYLLKFFIWERGYFGSLDMTHDRFGYYIAWGVLAFLPSVYTVAPLYLVQHPGTLSAGAAGAIIVAGVVCIYLNYQADEQRQRVRETNGDTTVWGAKPEIIRAEYQTANGETHENILLVSGWWGVARHFHYSAELGAAIAWTVPAGFSHFVPWLYPLFLATLLFDRTNRDELRCRGKYGRFWVSYCERVPWRIVPGIY
jgi:7-dehydrocholesterol reductase